MRGARTVTLRAAAPAGLLAAALAVAVPDAGAAALGRQALLDLARIAGGTFVMGDTFGGGRSDEMPLHRVSVSSFLLSRFEVTVGQFRVFVEETGYRTSAERQGGWLIWNGTYWEHRHNASWKNPYFPQTERDPVVMVSWIDAAEFCNWLSRRESLSPFYPPDPSASPDCSANGYRLPTEAEWEYAARSGAQDLKYAWGNGGPDGNVADQTLNKVFPAWPFATWARYEDGFVYTAPVGSFAANALGLFDMSGNVWEWCNDWYGGYPAMDQADPRGPAEGVTRCLRGGSWTDEPAALRVAFRSGRVPWGQGVNSGFRPARSVKRSGT